MDLQSCQRPRNTWPTFEMTTLRKIHEYMGNRRTPTIFPVIPTASSEPGTPHRLDPGASKKLLIATSWADQAPTRALPHRLGAKLSPVARIGKE